MIIDSESIWAIIGTFIGFISGWFVRGSSNKVEFAKVNGEEKNG